MTEYSSLSTFKIIPRLICVAAIIETPPDWILLENVQKLYQKCSSPRRTIFDWRSRPPRRTVAGCERRPSIAKIILMPTCPYCKGQVNDEQIVVCPSCET